MYKFLTTSLMLILFSTLVFSRGGGAGGGHSSGGGSHSSSSSHSSGVGSHGGGVSAKSSSRSAGYTSRGSTAKISGGKSFSSSNYSRISESNVSYFVDNLNQVIYYAVIMNHETNTMDTISSNNKSDLVEQVNGDDTDFGQLFITFLIVLCGFIVIVVFISLFFVE